jgi:hypothetical protein
LKLVPQHQANAGLWFDTNVSHLRIRTTALVSATRC